MRPYRDGPLRELSAPFLDRGLVPAIASGEPLVQRKQADVQLSALALEHPIAHRDVQPVRREGEVTDCMDQPVAPISLRLLGGLRHGGG